MAETTTIMPEKSGSPERVAFDLAMFMWKLDVFPHPQNERKKRLLDLYAECLDATSGNRLYPSKYQPSSD